MNARHNKSYALTLEFLLLFAHFSSLLAYHTKRSKNISAFQLTRYTHRILDHWIIKKGRTACLEK